VQERKLEGFGVFVIGAGDAAELRRHHLFGLVGTPKDGAATDDSAVGHVAQLENELGDDSEAGAVAPHAPEQLQVARFVHPDDLARCGHQFVLLFEIYAFRFQYP
jgi:hypothetical protein